MEGLKSFEICNAKKMLQFLNVVAANVPFEPNITNISTKSEIHRNSVVTYHHFLEQEQPIDFYRNLL